MQILGAPALTDMSALAGLEDTRLIFLRATGLTGLPELPGVLITHRFPMRDYRKAVRAFLNKRESGAIKIVLEH